MANPFEVELARRAAAQPERGSDNPFALELERRGPEEPAPAKRDASAAPYTIEEPVRGFNKGLINFLTLPYQAVQKYNAAFEDQMGAKRVPAPDQLPLSSVYPEETAEYLKLRADRTPGYRMPPIEELPLYKPFLDQPEPANDVGRYLRSGGEAVGGSVVPTGAILAKSEKLKKFTPPVSGELDSIFPRLTPLRSLVQQTGEFFARRPGTAVAADAVGAAAAGMGAQAARDAGLGPGFEIAAGAAAPVVAVGAPVTVVRTARGLLRVPDDAFTPTVARWKANGDAIFKRLGIQASADGSVPSAAAAGGPETAGGEAAAYVTLANTLKRANVPIEQLDTLLTRIAQSRRFYSNSYAPDAAALVDLDPALQKIAGSLMRENPEVWKRGVDFMYARQTGLTPPRGELPTDTGIPAREKYAPPITGKQALEEFETTFDTPLKSIVPMGQRERVGDALRRAMRIEDAEHHGHAPTASMTDTQLEAFAHEASTPAYNATRAAAKGVDLKPTLDPILDRWEQAALAEPGPVKAAIMRQIKEVRRAIEVRAETRAPSSDEEALARIQAQLEGAPYVAPSVRGPRDMSPFERFDKVKQLMDEVIGNLYNPGASKEKQSTITANVLTQFKNELLKGATQDGVKILPGVDDIAENGLGGLYSKARGIFSGVANARRALETGNKIWKGEAGLDEFNALEGDLTSQKLVRLGIHGGYEADTKNLPGGRDVTNLFDKPRLDEVLREIIPRSGGEVFHDTPERFGRYIAHEQMMGGTAKRTYQGSPTSERIADDKAAKELFDLTDTLRRGGWQQVVSEAAADVLNKMFGYRADTAATMGRVLFTADPKQRGIAIEKIRQHMGDDRFTYFQKLMADRAQRMVQAGVAVAPGAAQSGPPDTAVEFLQKNPSAFNRQQFEEKYGVSADRYLGAK